MDGEKAPLLGSFIRRDTGRPHPEFFLSIVALFVLGFLAVTIHQSANPDQQVWNVIEPSKQASPFTWDSIAPSRTLEWHSCFSGEYDCARLDLPADWLDPTEDDRVVLAIARLRAVETEDYRGPVFFNPGGPGGSGIWALKDHGKQLQTIVGKNHDIVTFDPRGIGASVPRLQCWDLAQKKHDWAMQETPAIDSHPGVLYDAWARASAYSLACEQSHNNSGLLKHIGTASHARDMLEMLTQMGEDKLQYWGFSYGTILGGTFAAMYPDKVGRLVSDGNVDYQEWYNNMHVNAVRDADSIVEAFYNLCHKAGPSKCALHEPSPDEIKERHLAILERLRVQPIVYMPSGSAASALPEIITYSKVRQLTSTSLYRPNYYFPHLAGILAGLEAGDGAPYYAFITRFGLPFSDVCTIEQVPPTQPLNSGDEGNDDAFPLILCADGAPLPQDPRDFIEQVRETVEISQNTGAIVVKDRIACAGRTVRPKLKFTGPFEAKTSFPILYIANMADNITPLVSARNNSAGFQDSVVLIQNSYGVSQSSTTLIAYSTWLTDVVPQHTSLAAPSMCTAKAVHAYFQEGVLPLDGTRCDPELLPFDTPAAEGTAYDDSDRALAMASFELSQTASWGLDKGERAV